jgi:membrane fusion protein (multidrug efflux system)
MSPRGKKVLRYLVVAGGLLLVVAALAGVKVSQISSLIAMGKEWEAAGPPPESVASGVAQAESWEGTLSAVGTVAGVESVAVSNDAPGRVVRIHFESGAEVKKGQVLVELDTSVERAQLASAKSRRGLARTNAARSKALFQQSVVSQSQFDNDQAQLEMANTDYQAIQAQIDRKMVRAPFAGRLGIRAVNVGQYLNPGTTLTTLEAVGGVFVDFTLPQRMLALVKDGMPVRISATQDGKEPLAEGTVSAIDPAIDEVTRSIKLRASIANESAKLRPGMFVNVAVVLPRRDKVTIVPLTAVVHAPYGDSLFVIEDKKADAPGMAQTPDGRPVKVARQQFVRLGEARGDFVVVREGIKPGEAVVSAGAFKLRNGSPIVIDNSVKPEPKLDPRPENQ